MFARMVVVAALAAAIAAPHLGESAGPQMCSAGGDWDAVAESDVIVGGRISGYVTMPDAGAVGMFTPVRLEMRVDHVFKGPYRGEPIVDRASLIVYAEEAVAAGGRAVDWAGSSGACGALNHDPAGWYGVFGLRRQADGTLQTNLLTTFYLQPQPYDVQRLTYLTQRLGLPALGDGAAKDAQAASATARRVRLAALAVAALSAALILRGLAEGGETSLRPKYDAGFTLPAQVSAASRGLSSQQIDRDKTR
jgi:hypothetical protein